MPSIPDTSIPARTLSVQDPTQQPQDPGLLSTIGAAGVTVNWPYRVARYVTDRSGVENDPNHNPFDMIKGTKYEADPSRFAYSRSQQETEALMRESDQDSQAREVLSRSGTTGTVAMLGMGLLDPTMFLPVAKVFTGAAEGLSVLRAAGDVAVAGGVGAAIGEGAMYGTTPDYTAGDVATGIGTGTLLGGILGAGAHSLLSGAERTAATSILNEDRINLTRDASGTFSPGGAAVSADRNVELKGTPLDKVDFTKNLSPTRQTLNSPFQEARKTLVDLAETPYIFKDNEKGIATTQGGALDRLAQLEAIKAKITVADTLNNSWTRYKFGQEDPSIFNRTMAGLADFRGQNGEKMTYIEFKNEVDRALRSGDAHPVPEVQEVAKTFREKLIDPWKQRAIDAGLLPEDVDQKTVTSYMTRIWNKQKLVAQRPEAVDRITNWLESEQTTKASQQEKIRDLQTKLDGVTSDLDKLKSKAANDEPSMQKMADLTLQHDKIRSDIEEELGKWQGQSTREVKAALKARAAAEAERAAKVEAGSYKGKGERLTSADSHVDSAVKNIVSSDRNVSRQELQSRANEIIERIVGNPDGRIPYDLGKKGSGGMSNDARGPLKQREFMIPDTLVHDFLDTDIERSMKRYLHTIIPDVMLTEKFGDAEMTEAFKRIEDEYVAMASNAKTEKDRIKLKSQYDQAVSNLAGIRDRIRGTYGFSSDPNMRQWGRIAKNVGKLNQMADLGGTALASLPDLAGPIFQYGLASAFKYQWAPLLKSLVSKEVRQATGAAKKELQTLGVAAETFLAMRKQGIGDVMEQYEPTSKFERGLDQVSDKFFLANLLTPWTDFTKWGAGMVSMNEMSRAVEAVSKNSATKKQISKLAESGIDAPMAERIWAEMSKDGGSEVLNGTRITSSGNWVDTKARDAYEAALHRDVDMMVITPGQEKMLVMSRNPAVALILQYKTFVQATTERMIYRGMQARDINAMQGYLAMLGLGMLSAASYAVATGKPENMPTTTADWVKQGMSRSGLTGYLEDINAISSKWSGGSYDMYRLIGASQPGTRYVERDKLGILLGSTANKLSGLIQAGGDASNLKWTPADTRRLKRAIPFMNLFYVRRLMDKLGESP